MRTGWIGLVLGACAVEPSATQDDPAEQAADTADVDDDDAPPDGGDLGRDTAADTGVDTSTDADTDPPVDTDPPPDVDGDGIPDADDPHPDGSDDNLLAGETVGGAARVVQIFARDAAGDAVQDGIYRDDLTQGCSVAWYPQGTLCDEPATTHSKTVSTKTDDDSGATFRYPGDGTVGVLVIDACATGACSAIDVAEARVFQMFSDGKTTHLQLAVHDARGTTPPAWNDTGWRVVSSGPDGFAPIGAGTDLDGDGLRVGDPTVIPVSPPVLTRYVRVQATNDGTLGSASYTEIRSVKLFGAAPP